MRRVGERVAIEAVARHFSTAWEKGEESARRLSHDRREANCRRGHDDQAADRRPGRPHEASPAIRQGFLGLVRRLQASAGRVGARRQDGDTDHHGPHTGAAKTAAALEDKIRACLARRSAPMEAKDTIHGNQIRVRLVKGGSKRTPKVIGLVHNPNSIRGTLSWDITHSLVECIGVKAGRGTPAGDCRRWMARSRRRRSAFARRAVSVRHTAVHPDRLQEDSPWCLLAGG